MCPRAWLGRTDGGTRQAQAKRRAAARAVARAWLTRRAGTSKAGQTNGLGRRANRRPKSSQNRDFGSYISLMQNLCTRQSFDGSNSCIARIITHCVLYHSYTSGDSDVIYLFRSMPAVLAAMMYNKEM